MFSPMGRNRFHPNVLKSPVSFQIHLNFMDLDNYLDILFTTHKADRVELDFSEIEISVSHKLPLALFLLRYICLYLWPILLKGTYIKRWLADNWGSEYWIPFMGNTGARNSHFQILPINLVNTYKYKSQNWTSHNLRWAILHAICSGQFRTILIKFVKGSVHL